MQTRALGRSGLFVSSVALGTMAWGQGTDEHEARELLHAYYGSGGRLIDTADVFADGASEEIVGSLLQDFPDMLVSSKAGTTRGARRRNASRSHLLDALHTSLRRLGREHIDVWNVHGWDADTPLEETLSVIQHALDSGKVRYAGVSNYAGWQLALACHGGGITAAQMEYSLVQRGIEREVAPACAHGGVGLMAWSPIGRGVLAGRYRHSTPVDSRGSSSHWASFVSPYLWQRPRAIVDAVCTAAAGLDRTPASVALSWVLSNPLVTCAIVGARTVAQVTEAMAATDFTLPREIADALNEVSLPDRGYPEWGWNQL